MRHTKMQPDTAPRAAQVKVPSSHYMGVSHDVQQNFEHIVKPLFKCTLISSYSVLVIVSYPSSSSYLHLPIQNMYIPIKYTQVFSFFSGHFDSVSSMWIENNCVDLTPGIDFRLNRINIRVYNGHKVLVFCVTPGHNLMTNKKKL